MSSQEEGKIASDFRVGVLTLMGVVLLVLGITFAGGDKGLLFKKTSVLKARLTDVGGLKKGSSVTMNGMVVGKVANITFSNGAEGNQIEVTMEVRSDVRSRIKKDSVPSVRTQGMLGDRYIDIPPGSENAEPLPEGELLKGASATDFDKTLNQALDVLNETEKMLSAVNAKEGTAGQLVYDPQLYNHLIDITAELNDVIKDFKKNPRRYIKFSVW